MYFGLQYTYHVYIFFFHFFFPFANVIACICIVARLLHLVFSVCFCLWVGVILFYRLGYILSRLFLALRVNRGVYTGGIKGVMQSSLLLQWLQKRQKLIKTNVREREIYFDILDVGDGVLDRVRAGFEFYDTYTYIFAVPLKMQIIVDNDNCFPILYSMPANNSCTVFDCYPPQSHTTFPFGI